MAKQNSRAKGAGRSSSATGGFFSGFQPGMSPISATQIDEGVAPTQEQLAPAVSLPMEAAPRDTGQVQVPNENLFDATGKVTPEAQAQTPTLGQTAGLATTVGNWGNIGALGNFSLGGDRGVTQALGTVGGVAGKVGGALGAVSDVQKGDYWGAAGKVAGMANPTVGLALTAGQTIADTLNGKGFFGGNVTPGSTVAQGLGWANQGMFGSNGLFGEKGVDAVGFQTSGALTSPVSMPGAVETTSLPSLGPAPAVPDTSHSTESYGGHDGFSGSAPGNDADGSPSGSNMAADGGMMTAGGFDRGVVGLSAPGYADGGAMGAQNLTQLGFAEGGGVGLSAPGMPPGGQPDPMAIVGRMVKDPAMQQKVQQIVGPAMQSGQLTPEELVTLGRIAEASIHNPQLYPQLRKFAEQNGMTPLPPSYDPRIATMLIVASKIVGGQQQGPMGATPPGQVPPTDQAQMQNPTGAPNGGMLRGPGTGRSDSIGTVNESNGSPVKVANGEYVIPKHVVDAKGKEFFDKMLRQYAQLTPQGA